MAQNFKGPSVNQIFNDLDKYRDFCRDYGYVFNERHLYDYRTPYFQFDRYQKKLPFVDNWAETQKRFAERSINAVSR
jgi:hypothetical protein